MKLISIITVVKNSASTIEKCIESVVNQNYDKIIDLFNKGLLIKNLIKPQYLS